MASIIARECSVAALVLPPGELITMIPLAVAAGTSILSTPTPARPMIFRFWAALITSAVTLEAERTISASNSGIISNNSSAGSLSLITHSKSSFKISTAVWETPSAINTFIFQPPVYHIDTSTHQRIHTNNFRIYIIKNQVYFL